MSANNAQLILTYACRNIPAPPDWDLSDLKLYHAMRLLYAEHGMLIVGEDQARREREQLCAAWRKEKRELTDAV